MASTYSNLKIQLMATGENSGTWGNVTNTNLGTALEQAITGSVDVTVNSDTTLSLTDTNAAQNARALRLNLTGSGSANLTVPAIQKLYLINNATLGTVTVKNATGATIAVPTTKTMWVFSTGTGVVDAVTHLSSLTLGSALPIASGGTGSTSTTYANLQTNVTGTLPVANGGTGSTTATFSGANITSLNASAISSGTLAVARGGTGSANAAFSGANITSLNASSISSGTLAVAQGGTGSANAAFSGANITSLNASSLSSGTVATGRLANSGTAGPTTFLRGDQAWAAVSSGPNGAFQGLSVYNNPGTFTTPANTTQIYLVMGSGGAGGGNLNAGRGGGGNGIVAAGVYTVTASTPYPVTVGGAGSGGTPSGNPGGSSSFGSLLTANGGSAANSTPNGSPGTAPLAAVTGLTPQPLFSTNAGNGGDYGEGNAGNPGVAGRVLVYF